MLEEEIITEKRRTLPSERTSELHIIDTINFTSLVLIVIFLAVFLVSRVFRDVASSIGKVEKTEYAQLTDGYRNFPLNLELVLTEVGKNYHDVSLFVTPVIKESEVTEDTTVKFNFKNTFIAYNKRVVVTKEETQDSQELPLKANTKKTSPVTILTIPSTDDYDEISCQFSIISEIPNLEALEIKWRYFTSNVEVNLLLSNLVLFAALIYAFVNYYKNSFHIDDEYSLSTYVLLNFVALIASFPWHFVFVLDFVPKVRMVLATILASTLRFICFAQLSSASSSTGQMPLKYLVINGLFYIVRSLGISYLQINEIDKPAVYYIFAGIELVFTIIFIILALKASVSLSIRKVVFFGGLLIICIGSSFTIENSWLNNVEDFGDPTSSNNYVSFYLVSTIFILFLLQLDNEGKYAAMTQMDQIPSLIHQEDNNALIADRKTDTDDEDYYSSNE